MPRRTDTTVDAMLTDLGGGSLDLLADGTWVWGSAFGEITGSGRTPSEAIAAAWAQLPGS